MLPASSHARLCNVAGERSQRQGIWNRVKDLLKTGSCSAASPQLCPPSAEIMTLEIRPAPEKAIPEISYSPGSFNAIPGEGRVMKDFTSCRK